MHAVLTFGHGTLEADAIVTTLRAARVELLVDIRRFPGSRRHPHLGRLALDSSLGAAGIHYRWDERLGGRRRPGDDTIDLALRNDGFRAYAEHMRTPEFLAGIDDLLRDTSGRRVAVMCSETVWWRCHRRLVADHLLLVREVEVSHLMPGGRAVRHSPTDGVRRRPDGLLTYDAKTLV